MRRLSRGPVKCTYVRSLGRGDDGRFRRAEATFPYGPATGELLFQTLDSRVMAVSYTVSHTAGGDSFAAGKPQVWTDTRLRLDIFPNYDLAADGKRLAAFVADDAKGEKPLTHLTFLLNFFDKLRRKAPAGK